MLAWLWVRDLSESEYLNLIVAWETSPSSNEETDYKKESTNERRSIEKKNVVSSISCNVLRIEKFRQNSSILVPS